MTTKRREIVIEGSDDGVNWKEYDFKYKPGDIARSLPLTGPHQPRLDWQFWFAALDSPTHIPWFPQFLQRLLEGRRDVTQLLDENPFPDQPPLYVRAMFYDYRFSSLEEKQKEGLWWKRDLVGTYYPSVHLK
jgi:hypothetical protein